MSFLGKILVVAQVAFAIILMLFAGAVGAMQQNWKFKAAKLQTDLKAAQDSLNDKTNELTKVQAEAKASVDKTEADKAQLANQVALLTTEVQQLRDREQQNLNLVTQKTENATAVATDDTARNQETLILREQNKELFDAKNELFKQKTVLEDKLFASGVKVDKLTEELKVALVAKRKAEEKLESGGTSAGVTLAGAPKPVAPPPHKVDGRVIELKKSAGAGGTLVAISIGKDDGLEVGHQVYVYRGPAYLGKVRILSTEPDKAVGSVIDTAKNGIIQEGDDVTTKL